MGVVSDKSLKPRIERELLSHGTKSGKDVYDDSIFVAKRRWHMFYLAEDGIRDEFT